MGATQPSSQAVSVRNFSTAPMVHRAVAGLLDDAVTLAQAVLRADAGPRSPHGVGGGGELIGLLEAPFGGRLQPIGDVVLEWAVDLAEGTPHCEQRAACSAALPAAKLLVDLLEVLGARPRHAFLGRNTAKGDKAQHSVRPFSLLVFSVSTGFIQAPHPQHYVRAHTNPDTNRPFVARYPK